MVRRIAASLLSMIVLPSPACTARAQGDPPQASSSADLQKFDASLAFLRARNARDYAAASPNGIDEGRYVEIGGIQQWITIRGDDRNNPVLLFLHADRAMRSTRGPTPASAGGRNTSPSCSGTSAAPAGHSGKTVARRRGRSPSRA